MKKIILVVLIAMFSLTMTYAYNPTSKDEKLLEKAEDTIYEIYEKYGIDKIKWLDKAINRALIKYKKKERIIYILWEFKDFINNEIYKPLELAKEEAMETEFESKLYNLRKWLVDKYLDNIVWDKDIDPRCMEKYDIIDAIAREYNFPTAMIIATWRAEYTCKVGNPNNGWGMFQITSQYFEPGEITDEEFENQVRGYIKFLRKKMERYIPAKKIDAEKYALEYDNYNIYSIQYASKGYNGYSWDPTKVGYTNWNLNSELEYKKDGIVTSFIKILKWELENK